MNGSRTSAGDARQEPGRDQEGTRETRLWVGLVMVELAAVCGSGMLRERWGGCRIVVALCADERKTL